MMMRLSGHMARSGKQMNTYEVTVVHFLNINFEYGKTFNGKRQRLRPGSRRESNNVDLKGRG